MSGLYPLTVNTDPSAEAHIYAEDDAAIYQAILGGDGVCNIGQVCEATVISNNKVRVADGVICVGGHMARIRYGEYQDCEIMNGQTGYNRNDIIVAKFVTTGSQGTDTYTIEVVQGTAVAGDATDPALTQGDLYEGEKIRMMPLYRVKIEGLSIVAVEQLFEVIPTIPELQAQVTELNGNLVKKEQSVEILIKTVFEYTAGSYLSFANEEINGDNFVTFNTDGTITINEDIECLIFANISGATYNNRAWIKIVNYPNGDVYSESIQYGAYATCCLATKLQLAKGDKISVYTAEDFQLNWGGLISNIIFIRL